MTNLEKYKKIFAQTLEINEDQLTGLTYQSVPAWDSVGHMMLISSLENAFDTIFDTADIIDFNSFERGIEILKKYGVQIA